MINPITAVLSAVSLLLTVVPTAHAEKIDPSIPAMIRIVVPFSAGASTDVMARRIANQLGPRLGTTVIVENRPGASGMIGSNNVVTGPKDGSSLVFASVSLVSAAAVTRNVPFDITKDLVPVAITGEGPLLIVVPAQSPIKTPADFIAAARSKPLSHGSGGVGTIVHLAAELLNSAAKTQLQHVPYKGAAPAVTDTIGGTLDVMLAANTTFSSQISAGRMRPIAVTSAQPSPAFPNVPTMASVVPGYSVNLWNVLFAPAGVPPKLLNILNREVNEISKSKEMVELMHLDGFEPKTLTLEQSAKQVRDAYSTWKTLAKERNIVLE